MERPPESEGEVIGKKRLGGAVEVVLTRRLPDSLENHNRLRTTHLSKNQANWFAVPLLRRQSISLGNRGNRPPGRPTLLWFQP